MCIQVKSIENAKQTMRATHQHAAQISPLVGFGCIKSERHKLAITTSTRTKTKFNDDDNYVLKNADK